MANVTSPRAPQNETAGMQMAERLLTLPCRAGWSRRQVVSFAGQTVKRMRAMGLSERANGFEHMALTIAKTRE